MSFFRSIFHVCVYTYVWMPRAGAITPLISHSFFSFLHHIIMWCKQLKKNINVFAVRVNVVFLIFATFFKRNTSKSFNLASFLLFLSFFYFIQHGLYIFINIYLICYPSDYYAVPENTCTYNHTIIIGRYLSKNISIFFSLFVLRGIKEKRFCTATAVKYFDRLF